MFKFSNHVFTAILLLLAFRFDFGDWFTHAAPAAILQHDNLYEDLFDDLSPESLADFNGGIDLQPFANMITQLNDYDRHYNQRQSGRLNIRLKLDGFVLSVPEKEAAQLIDIPIAMIDTTATAWANRLKYRYQQRLADRYSNYRTKKN